MPGRGLAALRAAVTAPYVIAARRSNRPHAVQMAREHAFDDLADTLLRRRRHLPPRRLNFVGDGDFEAIGLHLCDLLTDLGGLRPDSRVLDIGSGIGRVAIPLSKTLGPAGSYRGFDIVPEGVRWCRRHVASRHPDFRFDVLDVSNELYRPDGATDAASVRWPYPDAAFDVALAASVITHMRSADVQHYLRELRRVLDSSGRAVVTAFVLPLPEAGASPQLQFEPGPEPGTAGLPGLTFEAAVAFEEHTLASMIDAAGLQVVGEIHRGEWSGAALPRSYQDVLVLAHA